MKAPKLELRGEFWRIRYYWPDENGNPVRKWLGLGTTDADEAKRELARFKAGVHPKHPKQIQSRAFLAGAGMDEPANGPAVIQPPVKPTGYTMRQAMERALDDSRVFRENVYSDNYRSLVKLLSDRIGDTPVRDMTSRELGRLRDELRLETKVRRRFDVMTGKYVDSAEPQPRYSPSYIKRFMCVVTKTLRACAELADWIDEKGDPLLDAVPVAPKNPKSKNRQRIMGMDEQALIFQAIAELDEADADLGIERPTEPFRHIRMNRLNRKWWQFGLYVRLLLATGMRRGEALFMGPRLIRVLTDPETGAKQKCFELHAFMTKTRKGRFVSIDPDLMGDIEALNAFARTRIIERRVRLPDETFARQIRWEELCWFEFDEKQVERLWAKVRYVIATKHGLDLTTGIDGPLVLHSTRHTAITRLLEAGWRIEDVAGEAGHEDIQTTRIYDKSDRTRIFRTAGQARSRLAS